jgi:hypothetical protein
MTYFLIGLGLGVCAESMLLLIAGYFYIKTQFYKVRP